MNVEIFFVCPLNLPEAIFCGAHTGSGAVGTGLKYFFVTTGSDHKTVCDTPADSAEGGICGDPARGFMDQQGEPLSDHKTDTPADSAEGRICAHCLKGHVERP